MKDESMHTSDRRHWHQKKIVAIAHMAASKVLLRFKEAFKINRCEIVIGGHWAWDVDEGAQDHMPCEAHFKCVVPCQGARLITCHNSSPNNQVFIAPSPTAPAPFSHNEV